MLFEIVEDCLNLGSALQEFSLGFGHDLFALFVMRRCQDERAKGMSYLLMKWDTSVARIAHGDTGMLIHKVRYSSVIMNIRTRKDGSTQSSVVVDGRMELEAIVLTLPIVASVRIPPSDPMPLSPHQFAHGEHGSVHEPERCFVFEEAAQQPPHERLDPMTVADKILVIRQSWKICAVVLPCPVVDLTEGLLLTDEQIKYEDGNDFAVTEDARASSFSPYFCFNLR